mmetsp:Transcript_25265/g.58657  ORF Transcript_25265/g.58657 Transcript_25265/m.58657 type:complete len:301 (-) Transcript_25265:386-1288(-)
MAPLLMPQRRRCLPEAPRRLRDVKGLRSCRHRNDRVRRCFQRQRPPQHPTFPLTIPQRQRPLLQMLAQLLPTHKAVGILAAPAARLQPHVQTLNRPSQQMRPHSSGTITQAPNLLLVSCSLPPKPLPPLRAVSCRIGSQTSAGRLPSHQSARPVKPLQRWRLRQGLLPAGARRGGPVWRRLQREMLQDYRPLGCPLARLLQSHRLRLVVHALTEEQDLEVCRRMSDRHLRPKMGNRSVRPTSGPDQSPTTRPQLHQECEKRRCELSTQKPHLDEWQRRLDRAKAPGMSRQRCVRHLSCGA